jgi:hypothetical protein
MPPPMPAKVPPPAVTSAVPTVLSTPAPGASRAAGERGSVPGTAEVVHAQRMVGNAAVAAMMGATPPGAVGSGLPVQYMLLAAQSTVGNGALAVSLGGPAAPGTAPAPDVPAMPASAVPAAAASAGIVPGTVPPAGAARLGTAPTAGAPPTAPAVPGRPEPGPAAAPAAGGGPGPAASPAPAEAGTAETGARRGPHADPKFAALKKDVHAKKRAVARSHPPARTEAGAAQAAARPPADDREAQGKVANAEDMNAAQPKEFDKAAFIKAVEDAIAKRAPQNLKDADEFGDSDKADDAKKEVQGRVGAGKDDAAKDIETTTKAPPDTSKAVDKAVTPLSADKPPPVPGAPNPAQAVPDKLPPSATDTSAGPRQVNQEMADAQVTEPQLARSNEPQFVNALDSKHKAEQNSVQAQAKMRAHENKTLAKTEAKAENLGAAGMHDIAGQRVDAGQKVSAGKTGFKGSDEAKRAEVTATLQRVFDATKSDVEDILSGLDGKVDDQFSREEKQARDAFTAEHKQKMKEYKDKRYSGVLGKARWFDDWLSGLPPEANLIFMEARDHYVVRMRTVISNVADTVATELNRAKKRIAQGRTDLQDAVKKLPAALQEIGKQAAAEFADKFDELTQSVDDKGTELVDTLATRYTDALKSVDDEIAAEKEKNKGAVSKAVDAVKGVIKAIKELTSLLLGVLRKAAQALSAIINDPIGFLKNLVSAVGAGLKQFMHNIGKHLEQGIMSWLLGTAGEAGIQLPAKFDVRGIVLLIASLLGLTWANIRARIVRKVPDKAVTAAETALPLVAKAKKDGVSGLWDDIKERVGDLKKGLVSKVIKYLTPTIIIAGITWVLSLLNPASAFVRAVKLIIDIVRFVVERARQIIEFVDAVLDAVIAIAKGAGGGVPALVEKALARSIPVLIGLLAAILGVGGIANKVKQIFQTLSKPVNKAVDWVVDKIVGLVKKLWAKLKSKFDRKKPKKPKTKAHPDHDRAKDHHKPRRPGKRLGKDPRAKRQEDRRDRAAPRRPDQQREQRALDAALREANALVRPGATIQDIRRELPEIRHRHGLTSLRLVVDGETEAATLLYFEAVINPRQRGPRRELTLTREEIQESYGILATHQAEFQQYADERGIVIDVRATNPYSAPWIEEGAIPKPARVKAKTVQPEDMLVGGPVGDLGLVGFFQPTPGPPPGRPRHRAGRRRFAERQKEHGKYYADMQKLRPPPGTPGTPGRYEVVNKIVWSFTKTGEMRPLAGDNDLFRIQYITDDRLVRGHPYRELINEMIDADIGVQHGATVNWNPPDRDEVKLRIQVIKKARREKIIRFRPHLPPRLVGFKTPIQRVDRAR